MLGIRRNFSESFKKEGRNKEVRGGMLDRSLGPPAIKTELEAPDHSQWNSGRSADA